MLFIFGLILGSFISALTFRFPRGISNLRGRSFCDNCRKEIYWYDNIPLLSFIFLLGKCRNCGKKISFRYPIIELITGTAFYLIGGSPLLLILFLILFCIFIIDLENQIIPDSFVFLGLTFVFLISNNSFQMGNLFAGFFAATLLLFLHLITKGRGMGLGDVKFAVLGGTIVGSDLIFIWLLVAFLTGGIVGSILILTKAAKLKDKIAFGPFLIFAIPLTLIWGEKILTLLHL